LNSGLNLEYNDVHSHFAHFVGKKIREKKLKLGQTLENFYAFGFLT
jgi:hypothetical protein